MAGMICKQPNGLYCRYSSIIECISDYNMTKEDYLSNVTGSVISREDAEDTLNNHLKPYEDAIRRTTDLNMSEDEFNKIQKEMSELNTDGWKWTKASRI
ncbi:hypothetical protein ACI2JA_03695 [Alkalihalobacillus sp. NPDC078783]